MATSISRDKIPTYFNSKFNGTGYKIAVKEDFYDPWVYVYALFFEGEEIFTHEDWMEVIEYQRKHITLRKLIEPEEDNDPNLWA